MIIVVNIHIPYSETDQAGINSKNIELRCNYDWSHKYIYIYVCICMHVYVCIYWHSNSVHKAHAKIDHILGYKEVPVNTSQTRI